MPWDSNTKKKTKSIHFTLLIAMRLTHWYNEIPVNITVMHFAYTCLRIRILHHVWAWLHDTIFLSDDSNNNRQKIIIRNEKKRSQYHGDTIESGEKPRRLRHQTNKPNYYLHWMHCLHRYSDEIELFATPTRRQKNSFSVTMTTDACERSILSIERQRFSLYVCVRCTLCAFPSFASQMSSCTQQPVMQPVLKRHAKPKPNQTKPLSVVHADSDCY